MAWRQIYDDVPVSTSLNSLTHFGERLYWRLLSQTDAWGRISGDTVKIRDLCVPRLAVSDNDIQTALEELVRAGRIHLYCVEGRWACQLLDFDDNQACAKTKRGRSRHPEPPAKALQNHGSTDRETETGKRELSPTAVANYAELPDLETEDTATAPSDERLRFAHWNLEDVAKTLRGADAGTPLALASVLRGMPEGALARALESLEHRRGHGTRIESEARWLVGTISTMRREGQFV